MERRNRSEAAMITVIADCSIARVSTRRMNKLVKTLEINSVSSRLIQSSAGVSFATDLMKLTAVGV